MACYIDGALEFGCMHYMEIVILNKNSVHCLAFSFSSSLIFDFVVTFFGLFFVSLLRSLEPLHIG